MFTVSQSIILLLASSTTANTLVRVGPESYFPYADGHTYIRPGFDGANIYVGDAWAKNVHIGTNVKLNGQVQIGPASHFPYLNGHSYLRPGFDGGSIFIGDAWAKNLYLGTSVTDGSVLIGTNVKQGGQVHIGPASHLPYVNGHSYIRPGYDGGNIYVGDALAKNVHIGTNVKLDGQIQIGPASHLPYLNGHSYIRPGFDGGSIFIGDAWAKNLYLGTSVTDGTVLIGTNVKQGGQVHIGPASHLPYVNGHSYIRPGYDGGNIYVGDAWAKNVHIGSNVKLDGQVQIGPASHFPFTNGHSYLRPGFDGGNIFIGDAWAKQILLGHAGSTVTVNGAIQVSNKLVAKEIEVAADIKGNKLCLGATCLTEHDLDAILTFIKTRQIKCKTA